MKKIIIGILLFFAAVYLMLTTYFKDIVINKYPDKATVVREKAMENGLIPALLPDSAYNIAETHDDEKGDLFGSFYYKEKDETALLEQLKKAPEMNETYEWGDFLFHIDTQKNRVKFRNKK
jgi:hypothetical protein